MSRSFPKRITRTADYRGRCLGSFWLGAYAFALTAIWSLLLLEWGGQGHLHQEGHHTFHHRHFFFGVHSHPSPGNPDKDRQEPGGETKRKAGQTLSIHFTFLVLPAADVALNQRDHSDWLFPPTSRARSREVSRSSSPRGPPANLSLLRR